MQAAREPPQLTPDPDSADPFCYPHFVPPVLDRPRVICHAPHAGTVPDAARQPITRG